MLGLFPYLVTPLPVRSQGTGFGAGTGLGGGLGGSNFLAQGTPGAGGTTPTFTAPDVRGATPSTILPTDVLPLPAVQNRLSIGENFQLRMLQKLPSNFYFSGSCEASFRYETNPFQFPTKRKFLTQLPAPPVIRTLSAVQQGQILDLIGFVNNDDMIFRCLPNVTGGFTLTPHTRVFANYFMIRDSIFNSIRLNTVIHSIAGGIQQDFPIGSRANVQAEMQFRELYQLHQQAVFDFLPGLTASYVATPQLVLFANALLQMRGKRYFQAPTKEIDPFYTWGALFQRNGWTFSASSTLVQNFREPFRGNATIPVNNYAFILDFEVARRLLKQFPGLQGFVRAEPIYNFHSHNRPGLAGMDFRLFFGMRMAVAKPSLMAGLQNLRDQIEEQETSPPPPNEQAPETKPSAFMMPYEIIAGSAQPIHGLLGEDGQPTAQTISSHDLETAQRSAEAPALELKPAFVQTPIAQSAPEKTSRERSTASSDVQAPATPPEAAPSQAPPSVPAEVVKPQKKQAVEEKPGKPEEKPAPKIVSPVPVIADAPQPAQQSQVVARRPRSKAELKQFALERTLLEMHRKQVEEDITATASSSANARRYEKKPSVSMVLVPPLPSVNLDSKDIFDEQVKIPKPVINVLH